MSQKPEMYADPLPPMEYGVWGGSSSGLTARLLSRPAVGKSGCVAPGRRGGGGTEGIAHLDEAAAQGDPKHLPPAVLVPASNDHAGLQVVFVVVSHLADIKLVVS